MNNIIQNEGRYRINEASTTRPTDLLRGADIIERFGRYKTQHSQNSDKRSTKEIRRNSCLTSDCWQIVLHGDDGCTWQIEATIVADAAKTKMSAGYKLPAETAHILLRARGSAHWLLTHWREVGVCSGSGKCARNFTVHMAEWVAAVSLPLRPGLRAFSIHDLKPKISNHELKRLTKYWVLWIRR